MRVYVFLYEYIISIYNKGAWAVADPTDSASSAGSCCCSLITWAGTSARCTAVVA